MRRSTILDVAREAGVSKGLVSMALNDKPGVAPETRDRILGIAKRIGWRPSVAARSLTTRKAYALGFVVRRDPQVIEADPFFASFIAGVETVLSQHGQVLVLSVVSDVGAETRTYQTLVADRRVDGVLLADLLLDDARIDLVERLGLPAVTLGAPVTGGEHLPMITRDYRPGMTALVGHLVALGHRRIAHITGDERMLHGSQRRKYFESAMRENGLELVIESADFSPEQGAAATRRLLDAGQPPTAIIYGNDPMAIAGMAVAREYGLHLPQDLSIAGLDGSGLGSYVYPSLTTLCNDPADWGRASAETLLQLIEQSEAPNVELAPAKLTIKESTVPPTTRPHSPL